MSSNFSKKCLTQTDTQTHTQTFQVVEDSRLTTGVLKSNKYSAKSNKYSEKSNKYCAISYKYIPKSNKYSA